MDELVVCGCLLYLQFLCNKDQWSDLESIEVLDETWLVFWSRCKDYMDKAKSKEVRFALDGR